MDKKAVKQTIQRFSDDSVLIGDVISKSDPELKDQLADIDESDEDLEDVDIIKSKKEPGFKYSIDDKVKALLYLEIYQRDYRNEGLIPRFRFVGRLIDIDESTLRRWWSQRKEINLAGSKFVDKIDSYLKLMMTGVLIKAMKELISRDYKGEKMKDLNITISTIFNKLRLLRGFSTKNVAHKHRHELEGTVPEENED